MSERDAMDQAADAAGGAGLSTQHSPLETRDPGPGTRSERRPPDLSWMHVQTEWGVRAKPGKAGLRLGDLNIGKYGEIPDRWDNPTEMPRGAVPIAGVESMGYSVFDKHELWADNAADLYEEAIQRRWASARAIPWETLEPLPEPIERAICQICTDLSEWGMVEADTVAGWLKELSYGYHEVKLYLASTAFDGVRHHEAFRKRALANGGGLGLQNPGLFLRGLREGRNFAEFSVTCHVLGGSFILALLAALAGLAHNRAEQRLFGLALQDKARHVAYGTKHLRHLLQHRPDRRAEIHTYLERAERSLGIDDRDPALAGSLAILFAGGIENPAPGLAALQRFRRDWVVSYLRRLEWAGLGDRYERLNRRLAEYL